jgi:O-antigen ligase
LVGEPLILLVAGLTLANPRRTLTFAVGSLIATGVAVASYGIFQQYLGQWRLVSYGYSFRDEVRTIGGRLRSFGTLDQPFDYAAFLLLALAAVLFWMRRGPVKGAIIAVLVTGLTFSFVRGALVATVALLAILLVSWGRVTLGLLLLALSTATAFAFLVAFSTAHETHSVRSGPNTYITLNGRTTVWQTVFSKPSQIPLGAGVGTFGTAAQRAEFGVTSDPAKAQKKIRAVDSGYFATVADVGLVGLIVLILLFVRIAVLARVATRRAGRIGWLVIGWLAVLLIDAVFRASFTGFPTAFLGMLLIGIGLAASSTAPVSPSE